MSCSPYDLRDYFWGELEGSQAAETRAHVKTCADCGTELERLRETRMALTSLPDVEMPRRIGFVSDKVFEPSAVKRWWSGFWNSAARLTFASAAMVATALLVFALYRPAPVPMSQQAAGVPVGVTREMVDRTVRAAVQTAVTQAVSATQARDRQAMRTLLAAVEKRRVADQQQLLHAVKDDEYLLNRHYSVLRQANLASNEAVVSDPRGQQ